MDNFSAPVREDPRVPRRQLHPHVPPSHPAQQPPLPHMYGNFAAPSQNAYPQINMPIHMQRPQNPQPNLPVIQPQYPQYQQSSSQPGPNPTYTRQRDWDPSREDYERDPKRMRPFPQNSSEPPYPYNQPRPDIRVPQQISHHTPAPQSASYNQITPHTSHVPPNAPSIHPPSQHPPYPPRQVPFAQQPVLSSHQSQPDYAYPPKPAAPYPPQQQPNVPDNYDRLPAPPRKDFHDPAQQPIPPVADPEHKPEDKAEPKDEQDKPMSFKDFLAMQPDTISPQAAQEAFDEYVRDFTRRKPNKFFDLHKDEEWFRERYDPEYVSRRISRIEVEVNERAKVYKKLWDKGGSKVCAPKLTVGPEPTKQHSSQPGAQSGKSSNQSSPEQGEHSDTDDQGIAAMKDEAMMPIHDALKDEDTDTGETIPGRKAEQEPTSGDNKTDLDKSDKAKDELKMDVPDGAKTDTKAEAADVEEKAPKPEVEMGTEEVLKEEKQLLDVEGDVTDTQLAKDESDNTRPEEAKEEAQDKKNPEKDDSQVKKAEANVASGSSEDTDGDAAGLVLPLRREHQKDTIFMRGIPLNLARDALTEVLKHGPEGKHSFNLRRLKLGDINPVRSLQRFGWAVYDSEETAGRALDIVRGVVVRSPPEDKKEAESSKGDDDESKSPVEDDPSWIYEIDCMLNLERRKKFTMGRVLPAPFGTLDRMEHDVEQSVKMMRSLDSLRKIDEDLNPLTDEFLNGLQSDGDRLDHIVTYLREVHYFCYYSGNEFLEDPTSMPPQELRPSGERTRSSICEADSRLLRRVDERAKWVLERDYDRPRSNSDNGEAQKDEAIQQWLDSNTKNEGQGRYRCGLPPHKLFKGPEFVHKHLRTKHADVMKEVIDKALMETYRSNFENDASKTEVIAIFDEGMAGNSDDSKGAGAKHLGTAGAGSQSHGYSGMGEAYNQGRTNMPVGMYNAASPFMGMGIQPFPMMMMSTPGFPTGYSTPGYGNNMSFNGRGMSGNGMGGVGMGRMGGGGMMTGGAKGGDVSNMAMQRRSNVRGRDGGHREGGFREYRESGYRDSGGHRGRRGHPRRGGGEAHRRPLDPRASGPRRSYNDLDAPANGPSFDLVRYEDV